MGRQPATCSSAPTSDSPAVCLSTLNKASSKADFEQLTTSSLTEAPELKFHKSLHSSSSAVSTHSIASSEADSGRRDSVSSVDSSPSSGSKTTDRIGNSEPCTPKLKRSQSTGSHHHSDMSHVDSSATSPGSQPMPVGKRGMHKSLGSRDFSPSFESSPPEERTYPVGSPYSSGSPPLGTPQLYSYVSIPCPERAAYPDD